MKTFRVYGIATIGKYLGEVQAESEEEAKDKVWDELSDKMHISICHHCSREMIDTPEITDLQIEES